MTSNAGALMVTPLAGHWGRLGMALHFVARRAPFARFSAADLVATLDAQIRREHCLFALQDRHIVGYLGWACYDAAVAQSLAEGGGAPPHALANGRDVVWILTAVAEQPALMALVRALRAGHRHMRLMGVRHKAGGRRVVFDRPAPEGPARVLQGAHPAAG